MIFEGDQYKVKFTLSDSFGTKITPERTDNVRIKVNDKFYEYPNKGLFYDENESKWYFQLTEQETLSNKCLKMEVQAKIGTNNPIIKGTKTKKIPIRQGIIEEKW